MASLSRAQRQLQDTQPFEVAPPVSDARQQIRQSERSHGFRAAPPSYSMASPSNRPLRTTRVASAAPTHPTIAEGDGGAACPTTEEELESGDEFGGEGFDPIENNADDFQEAAQLAQYEDDEPPARDNDGTRVLQLEAELATTRLELARATQELNRVHTAMVRRARAEAELLPSTSTGTYWRPTRRS